MARVRNNHASPVGLPGNVRIRPGEVRQITGWQDMCSHPTVKMWLERGILQPMDEPKSKGGRRTAGSKKPTGRGRRKAAASASKSG